MKTIKSYSKVWNVEGTMYAIGDVNLPFPVTYSQIEWFIVSLVLVFIFNDVPPISLIDNWLIKFFGIPVGMAVLMSKMEFDGKKPVYFIKSYIEFLFRSKLTYGYKSIVKSKRYKICDYITVRGDMYAVSG